MLELSKLAKRRRLDELVVIGEANLVAFAGIRCDNGALVVSGGDAVFYTDFRYTAMVHRKAPALKTRDLKRLKLSGRRIGYESSVTKARYDRLVKLAPRAAKFVDIAEDLLSLRAVKTVSELELLRAAEKLNCEIWEEARGRFAAGMTERVMAGVIQTLMIERGEGEAFATIVCVGKHAAECHHEPDDTVWNGREPVLVDMGVKLNGVCSDLTRNVPPARQSALYRKVYALVKEAHDAAIAAARPGLTAKALDAVARGVIKKGGFGKCFGHSLGHGVGYEIHESPAVAKRGAKTVLKPGMVVTIEPGIYLEGNLGVRIEDMIVITPDGCERVAGQSSAFASD